MSFFEQNLEALRVSSAPLADRMETFREQVGEPTTNGPYAIEPARSGVLTAKYSEGDAGFYLHSPYDPQKEAEQFAAGQFKEGEKANFTIFFGLGLGYGVIETLKNIPDEERVMVFEPHWELFYLAFCHNDLTPLFTRPNTTLTCDPSVQGAMLNYMNLFELAGFKGLRLVSNDVFERLPLAVHFSEFAQRVRYEMTAVGGNVQTLMVMGEMQQMNIILNFPAILDCPPFKHLLNAFEGKPAVIVSAGPSLEKNMHMLKELKGKAFIIAVDTAIKPLMANDIMPHVVVSGDPQEENYRHLKGVDLPEVYFITEPQGPVASVRGWTGPKFICTFHDNMMKWIDRVIGTRGRVLVWGSVAVMAYDVAVKVGADPIVFIGQDLSFPGGKTYIPGTVFETEDKMEMTTGELEQKGTTLIDMEDIYGETVKTNRQMFAYFNFLLGRFQDPEVKGRTIINATEGGILKSPEVTVMTLAEARDQYMTEDIDVDSVLVKAHAMGNEINYTHLLIELDSLIGALRDALEGCHKGIEAVRFTLEALEADDDSLLARKEIIRRYNKMIGVRRNITRHPELSKIIEMANQAGIYAFAQGIKGTKVDAEYDKEILMRSCYHHHTLYQTSLEASTRLVPLFEASRDAAKERADQQGVGVGAGE